MLKLSVIILSCVAQLILAGVDKAAVQKLKSTTSATSVNNTFLQLIVDKSTSSAYLMTWPDSSGKPFLVKKYDVGMGRIKGDKVVEGDLKTPEGIYFSYPSFVREGQFKKFGPLAIPLNYPNAFDVSEKKTGSGIWLHGVGLERSIKDRYITEGCVAFDNSEIINLKNVLLPHQSVVVIANDIAEVNSSRSIKQIEQNTLAWQRAWAGRNLDLYQSFYSPDFVDPNKGKYKHYFIYKKAVFERYEKMDVRIDHVRVAVHPKYAVSVMRQYFKGDSYLESQGTKTLYWKREIDNTWKIFREEYNTFNFKPQKIVKIHNSRHDSPSGSPSTPL